MDKGTFFGIGRSGGSYWTPQKQLDAESVDTWLKGRVGLTMPSVLTPGINDGAILPCYIAFRGIPDYDGVCDHAILDTPFTSPTSGFFEAEVFIAEGELQYIFSSCDKDIMTAYFSINITTDRKPQISIRRDVATTFSNLVTADTALSEGSHIIRWGSTGSAYYINVDGSPVSITASVGSNNGKWIGHVANRDRIGIGTLVRSTTAYTKLRCSYVKMDNTNLWICNNEQYFYDVIGGVHIPIQRMGVSIREFGGTNTYLFDYGYSLYKINNSNYKLQIPHKVDGSPLIDPIIPIEYSYVKEVSGDLDNHNLADSMIYIPGDSWDRSDTAIYSDAIRANNTFYDALNPNRWHVEFFNRQDFSVYAKTDHQGLSFSKFLNNSVDDRLSLKELFSFATNKEGNYLTAILNYTKDNKVFSSMSYLDIVIEGHSLITDHGLASYGDVTTYMDGILGLNSGIKILRRWSYATPGAVISDLVGRKATNVDPCYFNVIGIKKIAIVFIGTNDITGSAGQGTTLYNALHGYVDSLISGGWTPLIITMAKYGVNASVESERLIYNNLIKGNPDFDYVVDIDLLPAFSDVTNLTYYGADQKHFTETANEILAGAIAVKLLEI